MFAMTELEQPLWRIARHTFLYPEAKRLPQDIVLAREEFAAMATILDRHMEGRQFMRWHDDRRLRDGLCDRLGQ